MSKKQKAMKMNMLQKYKIAVIFLQTKMQHHSPIKRLGE